LAVIFGLLVIISVGLLIAMLVKEDLLFLLVRDFFIRPIVSINLGPKLLYFIQVLIFLGLMVVQSLLVPIPSELILLSGGIIFGVYWGSVIGLAGSMLSATVTYYISKRGGRALVDASGEKVGIIKRTIYIFDEWIKSWGLWAILVGRAVPVIMFDPISYAAGIAKVKDWHYFLATFIGSIPRAIVYAFLGWKLIGSDNPVTKEKKEAVGEQTDTAIDENDEAELKKIRSELEEIKDEPIEIEATSSEGPQFKEPEPEDIEEIDVVEESEEEEERFGDAFE